MGYGNEKPLLDDFFIRADGQPKHTLQITNMKFIVLAIAAAALSSCASKPNPAPSTAPMSGGYVTPAK